MYLTDFLRNKSLKKKSAPNCPTAVVKEMVNFSQNPSEFSEFGEAYFLLLVVIIIGH